MQVSISREELNQYWEKFEESEKRINPTKDIEVTIPLSWFNKLKGTKFPNVFRMAFYISWLWDVEGSNEALLVRSGIAAKDWGVSVQAFGSSLVELERRGIIALKKNGTGLSPYVTILQEKMEG